MAEFQFNADGYTPSGSPPSRGPLPKGRYTAIVMESSIRTTKLGTGQYIELVIQIVDGAFAGRRVWERLNVSNPNKVAEDIALAKLQSLCSAVHVTNLTDTMELHDIPFFIDLDIDRKEPSRNRVDAFSSATTANVSAPAPSAPAKKPWER